MESTVPDPLDLGSLTASALWRASADALVLVDVAGIVVAANPAAVALFDIDPAGASVESLIPEDQRASHVDLRRSYELDPRPRPMAASRHLEGRRADGSRFPVAVSLGRVPTAPNATATGGDLTLAAVRDLTDRARAEARVVEAERARALAEDHDRIASDLHDTVIQRLFALGLGLQGLPDRVTDPIAADRIADAVDTLDDIIREIRQTIHGLRRPPTSRPVRERLVEVIEEVADPFAFVPEVRLVGDLDALGAEVAAHVEPVLREMLSNVGRHAEASSVSVVVSQRLGWLEIRVEDDGVGVAAPPSRRSGLDNLADRAAAAGGTFELGPGADAGAIARWRVPVTGMADTEQS